MAVKGAAANEVTRGRPSSSSTASTRSPRTTSVAGARIGSSTGPRTGSAEARPTRPRPRSPRSAPDQALRSARSAPPARSARERRSSAGRGGNDRATGLAGPLAGPCRARRRPGLAGSLRAQADQRERRRSRRVQGDGGGARHAMARRRLLHDAGGSSTGRRSSSRPTGSRTSSYRARAAARRTPSGRGGGRRTCRRPDWRGPPVVRCGPPPSSPGLVGPASLPATASESPGERRLTGQAVAPCPVPLSAHPTHAAPREEQTSGTASRPIAAASCDAPARNYPIALDFRPAAREASPSRTSLSPGGQAAEASRPRPSSSHCSTRFAAPRLRRAGGGRATPPARERRRSSRRRERRRTGRLAPRTPSRRRAPRGARPPRPPLRAIRAAVRVVDRDGEASSRRSRAEPRAPQARRSSGHRPQQRSPSAPETARCRRAMPGRPGAVAGPRPRRRSRDRLRTYAPQVPTSTTARGSSSPRSVAAPTAAAGSPMPAMRAATTVARPRSRSWRVAERGRESGASSGSKAARMRTSGATRPMIVPETLPAPDAYLVLPCLGSAARLPLSRLHAARPSCSLLLLAAPAMGCTGAVSDSSRPRSTPSRPRRAPSSSSSAPSTPAGGPRAEASARFVRVSAPSSTRDALRTIGATVDLPAPGNMREPRRAGRRRRAPATAAAPGSSWSTWAPSRSRSAGAKRTSSRDSCPT